MAEYTKIETARSIICDMCECLYQDGYCPEKCDLEKCDWMEHLKEDAADVAPVVNGRWIGWGKSGTPTYENYGTCSVCGEDAEIYTEHRNYCPNCGAKMDGDDDAKAD